MRFVVQERRYIKAGDLQWQQNRSQSDCHFGICLRFGFKHRHPLLVNFGTHLLRGSNLPCTLNPPRPAYVKYHISSAISHKKSGFKNIPLARCPGRVDRLLSGCPAQQIRLKKILINAIQYFVGGLDLLVPEDNSSIATS